MLEYQIFFDYGPMILLGFWLTLKIVVLRNLQVNFDFTILLTREPSIPSPFDMTAPITLPI